MPNIGDKISFIPSAFMVSNTPGRALHGMPRKVKATVTYVNEAHHWFRATYDIWGQQMHECFKF